MAGRTGASSILPVATISILLVAAHAGAFELHGGLGNTNLGGGARNGLVIGLGHEWPIGTGGSAVGLELAYVEKGGKGELARHEVGGGQSDVDCEIRLNYLETSVFIRSKNLLHGKLSPRVYVGGGVGYLIRESIDSSVPERSVVGELRNVDALGHLGLVLGYRKLFLDFRITKGFLAIEADDPEPYSTPKEAIFSSGSTNAKTTDWRATLGITF